MARLRPLANQGDANAQYPDRCPLRRAKDLIEAARYYKMAADQGHAEARSRLASLTCNGLGVPKNMDECVRLYRLAADAGVTQAQVSLGARYLMGDGIPPNHDEAARLAGLAAAKGDAVGELLLGMCTELGAGVPKDKDEALRLYKLSADKGNASAQKALQRLSGDGPPPQKQAASVRTIAVALDRRAGVLTLPTVLNQAFRTHFVVDSGASTVVISESIVDRCASRASSPTPNSPATRPTSWLTARS